MVGFIQIKPLLKGTDLSSELVQLPHILQIILSAASIHFCRRHFHFPKVHVGPLIAAIIIATTYYSCNCYCACNSEILKLSMQIQIHIFILIVNSNMSCTYLFTEKNGFLISSTATINYPYHYEIIWFFFFLETHETSFHQRDFETC